MEIASHATFGTLLRQLRLAKGLSQEALAERSRVSVDAISALERGTRRSPQRQTITMLADGLALQNAERLRLERAAEPARRALRRVASVRGETATRHNLPLHLTSFLGRESEAATVASRLTNARLVSITGIGGIGKTRLAFEVAHRSVNAFDDGVWLVEFAPVADPATVVARIAAVLGFPQRFNANDMWIEEISKRHILIVLDNCEHLVDAVANVTQAVLERCPRVHILTTSREPLRVPGEKVFRLDALELPRSKPGVLPSVDALMRSPAIALFFDRARLAMPDFALPDDDIPRWRKLQTICTRLDGLPLAIELAAARLSVLTLDMLAHGLDRRFDILTAGARTALPRHQTLRAMLDWSFDLLTQAEERVLCRLSVFAGGWTLQAAQCVCLDAEGQANDLMTILPSLVDKSLVVADTAAAEPRYTLLETTRAYAKERLIASGQFDAVARAHATYFLQLLQRANANWGRPSVTEWLRALEPELDNLRAAMHWSLGTGTDHAVAAGIAKAQHTMFELLSLFGEGREWCERALSALGPNADPRLAAPLLVVISKFSTRAGYAERGLSAAMRAVKLYRDLAEPPADAGERVRAPLVIALGLVARNLFALRRIAEADAFADEAMSLARDVKNEGSKTWALYVKSLTIDAADIDGRRRLLIEARRYAEASPDAFTYGLVIIGLGQAEFDAHNLPAAREYARSAAAHFSESGQNEDLTIWARSLSSLAALADGDLHVAHDDARDALLRSRDELDVSCPLQVFANLAARWGNADQATRLIAAADALFSEMMTLQVPFLRVLHAQTLEIIERALPDHRRAVLVAEGRRWTLPQAIAAALQIEAPR